MHIAEAIHKKLSARNWLSITETEWTAIIKSLIREEKEHEYAIQRKTLDEDFLSLLPKIGVAIAMNLDTREMGEIVMATVELRRIPKDAKRCLKKAFDRTVSEIVGSKSAARLSILDEIINLGRLIGGVLSRETLERALAVDDISDNLRKFLKKLHRSSRKS